MSIRKLKQFDNLHKNVVPVRMKVIYNDDSQVDKLLLTSMETFSMFMYL